MVRFFRRKQQEAIEEPPEGATAPSAPEQPVAAEPAEAIEAPHDVEDAVEKTRRTWFSRIGSMFRRGLDDELWDELEETLIAADTGVETTVKVLENLKERVRAEGIRDPEQAEEALKEELLSILEVDSRPGRLWAPSEGLRTTLRQAQGEREGESGAVPKPAVILVIGVNGTGKTTSIAKLARR
jgi:fused signal recognition particle receptor